MLFDHFCYYVGTLRLYDKRELIDKIIIEQNFQLPKMNLLLFIKTLYHPFLKLLFLFPKHLLLRYLTNILN